VREKGDTDLPSMPLPCSIHAIAEMARHPARQGGNNRPAV
jgi:hypothetical protein